MFSFRSARSRCKCSRRHRRWSQTHTHTHTHDHGSEFRFGRMTAFFFYIHLSRRPVGSESSACNAYLNMPIDTRRLTLANNHNEYFICIIRSYSRSYRFIFSSLWCDGAMHDRRDYLYLYSLSMNWRPESTALKHFICNCTRRCSLCLGWLAFLRCTRSLLTGIACKCVVGVESDKKGLFAIHTISSDATARRQQKREN